MIGQKGKWVHKGDIVTNTEINLKTYLPFLLLPFYVFSAKKTAIIYIRMFTRQGQIARSIMTLCSFRVYLGSQTIRFVVWILKYYAFDFFQIVLYEAGFTLVVFQIEESGCKSIIILCRLA